MTQRRSRNWRPPSSGAAGVIASFVVALAAIGLGTLATYISDFGASLEAAPAAAAVEPDPLTIVGPVRERIVKRLELGEPLERLTPRSLVQKPAVKPRIVIILDDMGIDDDAAREAIALPGPITYSFLPYGRHVDVLAAEAKASGAELMLHLPMEPMGDADPGPNALSSDMSGAEFLRALDWNLGRFDGFIGVNNHMGSKLTTNRAAMKTVLAHLKEKDIFFLDSVTTSESVAKKTGADLGEIVLSRDVFLDAETGDPESVRKQLELTEHIAEETGYAIAIGHPRPETLEVLGPWLLTAEARGFELAPISSLLMKKKAPLLASKAPKLRL